MNELKKLLDEDPACVGKYEFLHYKESEDLNFSDVVLQRLKALEAQDTVKSRSENFKHISELAQIAEDSAKKTQ